VNDTPRELPSSAARRGSAGLLAGFAQPWDSARRVLAKPFTLDTLLQAVEGMIGKAD
jgi:hypothetical protein